MLWGLKRAERLPCLYRVSLKKRSLTRLAPLEAPRLFLGLEIIPKCYQILFLLVRRSHLPIFIPFIGGFPQIMDHLSKTKSIADMYCSVCIRILYSKIFNNIHEKWFIQVDSFPISSGKLHLYKFSLRTWQVIVKNSSKFPLGWFIHHCSSGLVLACRIATTPSQEQP